MTPETSRRAWFPAQPPALVRLTCLRKGADFMAR
jgi:hypothetical protein